MFAKICALDVIVCPKKNEGGTLKMIEVIYNKEDKKTAGTDLYLKLPKNIRQIGEPDGKRRFT